MFARGLLQIVRATGTHLDAVSRIPAGVGVDDVQPIARVQVVDRTLAVDQEAVRQRVLAGYRTVPPGIRCARVIGKWHSKGHPRIVTRDRDHGCADRDARTQPRV
jgi:hypothetical protein